MRHQSENDGFFGAGHTPDYYLKKLKQINCPADIYDTAKEITQTNPFTEEIGDPQSHNYAKTVWDGENLYYFGTWAEGEFQRVQFEAETGYVDWGYGPQED